MDYKGFYIWYNELQRLWLVQAGHAVLGGYPSLGAAKGAVTRKFAKEDHSRLIGGAKGQ